jgi:hypothetical protein
VFVKVRRRAGVVPRRSTGLKLDYVLVYFSTVHSSGRTDLSAQSKGGISPPKRQIILRNLRGNDVCSVPTGYGSGPLHSSAQPIETRARHRIGNEARGIVADNIRGAGQCLPVGRQKAGRRYNGVKAATRGK